MKSLEDKVLAVVAKKRAKVITYDDLHVLRPPGKAGGHWLYQVKKILLSSGWKVHPSGQKASWGACGFGGSKTHFHKAE